MNCETHDLPANRDGECELCKLQPDRLRDPFRTQVDDEDGPSFFVYRETYGIPFYRSPRIR
jgi:hypothetical protein